MHNDPQTITIVPTVLLVLKISKFVIGRSFHRLEVWIVQSTTQQTFKTLRNSIATL